MNTKPFTLIRIGLALVFLANSLNAFFNPGEFNELINGSFLSGILPVSIAHFIVFIGINDALVALLLILGVALPFVTAWAVLWIFGVMIIKGFSIGTLEESGFLFMAIYLISVLKENKRSKNLVAVLIKK